MNSLQKLKLLNGLMKITSKIIPPRRLRWLPKGMKGEDHMMTFVDFVVEYYGHLVDFDKLDEYEMYMLCKLYEERVNK